MDVSIPSVNPALINFEKNYGVIKTLPERLSGVSGLYTEVFALFFFLGGGLIDDFFVLGFIFN